MKRKLKVTGIVFFVIIAIALVIVLLLILSGNNVTIANVIVTDSGIVYMDHYDKTVMLTNNVPEDLKTGDKCIIVYSSTFAESRPEQTRTLLVIKLKSGTEKDVSEKTMEILDSLAVD